ncbi:MAG TPA: RNA polymerase sigma factor SigW [Massilibacterium sp.]|nr:RNA polymerase sigma factor SigW [Massilibacterium sp.]
MKNIEKHIIKKVKKGDHQAFAELVELYKTRVYYVCYRLLGNKEEAEDAAQETFLKVFTSIDQFDLSKKFSTWLFRIATNTSIDRLRKKKPAYSLDAEMKNEDGQTMSQQLKAETKTPEENVETKEVQEWVQEAIQSLPTKYRTVISLKYINELSLKEISEILDIPVATVKTRLHRGREALRKKLRKFA